MLVTLTVLSGPFAGQTIEVPRGKLLVGREFDCQVRPDSVLVSRHHCVFLLDEYALRIRDLGSKNGTFVNDQKLGISETILSDGDAISIGDMVCQVRLSPQATGSEPAAPDAAAVPHPLLSQGAGVVQGDTVQLEGFGSVSPAARPGRNT